MLGSFAPAHLNSSKRRAEMSIDPNECQENGATANRRATRLLSAVLIVLAIGYEIANWLLQKGGAFSVLAAAISIHGGAADLIVDKYGLLALILLLVWLGVAVVCWLIKIRLGFPERPTSVLVILAFLVVAIGFNWLFGEAVLTKVMAANGYHRCVAGDYTRWNAKSHVVFIDYTRDGQSCRRASG
jgi:hypothetical protein